MASWLKNISGIFKQKLPIDELLRQVIKPEDKRTHIRPLGQDWLCAITGRRVETPDWDGQPENLLKSHQIMLHLTNLPQIESEGVDTPLKPWEELLQTMLVMRIQLSPSYRIASEKGEWVCPHCVKNSGIIIRQWDGTIPPPDWYMPQLLKHFNQCESYLADPLNPTPWEQLQNLQGEGAVRSSLIAGLAGDPRYRVCDETGAWICPFSHRAIDDFNLLTTAWDETFFDRIIAYMLSPECPARYSLWKVEASLESLREAALLSDRQRAQTYARDNAQKELKYLHQRLDSASAEQQKHNLEIAHEIQRSLLPTQAPQIDGYKITGFHHSSDVLGGDIYYFLNVSETQTGFLIADISGHGVQAAQVMSFAVESFNKHSLGAQSAAAILCAVNADLHEHISGGRFITAFLGILEHSTGKLRFVRAGHVPALLHNPADGSIKSLAGEGLALGIGSLEVFKIKLKEYLITVPHGGTLLMHTDGILNACSVTKQTFGNERLQQALQQTAGLTPGETITHLLSSMKEFVAHGKIADDITLLAIQRLPQQQTLDPQPELLES